LAQLQIRVVLTDGNGEKAEKLTWWSPVMVSFLGPVTILETTSSDGSPSAKERACTRSITAKQRWASQRWWFCGQKGEILAGTPQNKCDDDDEGRKEAGDQACSCGTGGARKRVRHTPAVTDHAYMNEWMNEWMIKWMNVRKLINFSVGQFEHIIEGSWMP
jgi:hypothetical protein